METKHIPAISICDIMCEYIRRMVKEIKAKEIEDYFRRDPGIDIVKADYVGDTDVLVPRYPHSINPQNFYPHPILFIECSKIGYDNEDKNLRKRIIEDSLLYKRCLDFAEKHNGCVTFFDVKLHQSILKRGDIIICLDQESYNRTNIIRDLNRTVGFRVLNLDEIYEMLDIQD